MRIIYHSNASGDVERVEVKERSPLKGAKDFNPHLSFHERMMKDYYKVECSGKPWRDPEFSKSQVKRIHETALQRDAATG